MLKPFSLLVKPASADCNLQCDYCFYLDRSALYPETRVHRMSFDTLERLVSGYMATPQPHYAFCWQGGEPTLMGLDFFQCVTTLQAKYGKPGSMVTNALQTNGTLITDKLAEHMARYCFLVGVSLDGPAEIHDQYRKFGTSGSHRAAMRGISILRRHRVRFNIIVLVSASNVHLPRLIYEYVKTQGFDYVQFVPCVEFDENSRLASYAINGREWGQFLCRIFDLWLNDDEGPPGVRLFDALAALLVDNRREICHLGNECSQYFVVEHNGDVYPCDFFVRKDLHLGNIQRDSWETLQKSQIYTGFSKMKSIRPKECLRCPYLQICLGDCLKHRSYSLRGNQRSLSLLCEGWIMFFNHALPVFKSLAAGRRIFPSPTVPEKQILS